ncbi:MAG: hypothetical protein HYY01_00670 [Chloroflexi bacterium]|nr:hypothetical protein [Chloroflexota bacterium]
MPAYSWRRCPRCRSVYPGGRFSVLRYGASHYHQQGSSLRKCPACGYVAFTQKFVVVNVGEHA